MSANDKQGPRPHGPKQMVASLTDMSIPLEHRIHMTAHLCMDPNPDNVAAIDELLKLAAKNNGEAVYEKKIQEVATLMEELASGPLRSAMFLQMLPPDGHGQVPRARTALEDGGTVYPVVPNAELAESLRCGELVLLDAQADRKSV